MGTFLRTDSDESIARKSSELNPSPLSQQSEQPAENVYQSQISFTMDIICPWTYLAKKRLDIALEKFRASPSAKHVNFTIKYLPFQLYPEMSTTGEDKYEWYKREKYNGSEEQMKKYTTVMSAYGVSVGIDFNFGGTIANTLNAHRLLQHHQQDSDLHPRTNPPTESTPSLILSSLYTQYHTLAQPPASPDTLLRAALAAGVDRARAEAFIGDEYESLPETKMLLQEQRGNGVDSVPIVVVEGRKRDFELVGLKEVEEYVKVLAQAAEEGL